MAVATEEIHCARLRDRIQNSLLNQGFVLRNNELLLPDHADKDTLRNLHALAVQSRIEQARPALERHEPRLLRHIASGAEVVPERISPRLVEVGPGTENELLFRYARRVQSKLCGRGRRTDHAEPLRLVHDFIEVLGIGHHRLSPGLTSVAVHGKEHLTDVALVVDGPCKRVASRFLFEATLSATSTRSAGSQSWGSQDTSAHYALGQITEVQLRNVWHEDPTMRSLIRQRGRVGRTRTSARW
jgi:uncharacterized protein DUF4338